ncbi:MAG: hypothetical protein JO224_07545 [Pelomonas sp.]|nr:hypothetical protein [Roseateles sp.]
MLKRSLALAVLATLATLVAAGNARADALSAPASEAVLAQGAIAWDVRADAAAGLPGALHIDAAALDAWLARRDLGALEAAVSRAGIDLSRDLVVYGEPGDARAQALVASLRNISRAQVHWLVGGAAEWAMSGRALAAAAPHAPVPQHLLAASQAPAPASRMAAATLRASVALDPPTAQLALR